MSVTTTEIGKKKYVQDSSLEDLANEVIRKNGSQLALGDDEKSKARIVYLKVYPEISKTVAGRCIRCSPELKFFGDCDYIIEMSGKIWDALADENKYLLMLHELMHIHVDYDKKGKPRYKMVDHDVQDFMSIISKHGVNWLHAIHATANSMLKDDEPDLKRIKI